jgi:hypothetical protein
VMEHEVRHVVGERQAPAGQLRIVPAERAIADSGLGQNDARVA